ncbi:hypothetical protein VaNZ11_006235, partial [Volvox africanus]
GMLSPDGRCKTLDAAADGYVRGEAVGALVLAALSLEGHVGGRDGDGGGGGERGNCLALVRASAVNQDGRSSSLTAPNGPAQQAVVRAALAEAGLPPNQLTSMEMHGTGTPLGDPIEVG